MVYEPNIITANMVSVRVSLNLKLCIHLNLKLLISLKLKGAKKW